MRIGLILKVGFAWNFLVLDGGKPAVVLGKEEEEGLEGMTICARVGLEVLC